jgi:hypothetical protein
MVSKFIRSHGWLLTCLTLTIIGAGSYFSLVQSFALIEQVPQVATVFESAIDISIVTSRSNGVAPAGIFTTLGINGRLTIREILRLYPPTSPREETGT